MNEFQIKAFLKTNPDLGIIKVIPVMFNGFPTSKTYFFYYKHEQKIHQVSIEISKDSSQEKLSEKLSEVRYEIRQQKIHCSTILTGAKYEEDYYKKTSILNIAEFFVDSLIYIGFIKNLKQDYYFKMEDVADEIIAGREMSNIDLYKNLLKSYGYNKKEFEKFISQNDKCKKYHSD